MSLSLQILLSGLAAGGIYGLLAVGHTLVYRLTGIVHFAFGDLVGLAMFVALLVVAGRGSLFAAHVGAGRFLLALAVGVIVCALASAATYLAAIAPHAASGSIIGWAGRALRPPSAAGRRRQRSSTRFGRAAAGSRRSWSWFWSSSGWPR